MFDTSLMPAPALAGGHTLPAELQKALAVGYPNLPGGAGSPLQAQSLDPLVLNLNYTQDKLALRRKLSVKTVNSTVQEYAELTSYGSASSASICLPEQGVPRQSSAQLVARYTTLKHTGLQDGVTFAAIQTAGGSIVDPLNFVTRNLVMTLLQQQEDLNFNGNSVLSPLQYDGVITQMLARAPAENIRDLRGLSLTQDEIMQGSAIVANQPKYGTLTDLFINTQCKGDLGRSLIAGQRTFINGPQNADQTILGIDPEGVRGVGGVINLNATPFLTDGGSPAVSVTGNPAGAPAVPTVSNVAAGAPQSGQQSQFSATSDVGEVSYVVVAENSEGTSAPVFATPGATVAVAQGQVVNLTVTPGAGVLPNFFSVYRVPTNSADLSLGAHRLILRVPNTVDGIPQNAAVTFSDTNAKLPGTYDAIAMDMQPGLEFCRLLQTAPMARVPLGIVGTAFNFMVVQSLATQLRAPGRCILWRNVGILPPIQQPV